MKTSRSAAFVGFLLPPGEGQDEGIYCAEPKTPLIPALSRREWKFCVDVHFARGSKKKQ